MQELDLAYIYLGKYAKWEKSNRSFLTNLIHALKLCCIHILKNILYFLSFKNKIIQPLPPQGSIWIMVSSLNTYHTLSFLKDALSNSHYITTNTNKNASDLPNFTRLSFHPTLLYIYRFPFTILQGIIRHGAIAILNSHRLLESCGMYETCLKAIKIGKPQAIIFSNDHIIKNRGLLLAAKHFKIPTIYLQHASITDSFPPLKFSLNLLEGQDALDKYTKIGEISGETKLVGMAKYDQHHTSRKKRRKSQSIGICLHLLDNENKIKALHKTLSNLYPAKHISIRPHPRESRNFSFLPPEVISNSKVENIFDYLKNQDLIICGNSSTHLEATLLNIPSISFNMGSLDHNSDYYGYINNNLIQAANNLQELTSIINEFDYLLEDVFLNARYYNATTGTTNEGKSQLLCINEINSFLKNHTTK